MKAKDSETTTQVKRFLFWVVVPRLAFRREIERTFLVSALLHRNNPSEIAINAGPVSDVDRFLSLW